MYSKKINQLATNLNPQNTDLIPIGDPTTGQLKTITYNQLIQSGGVPTSRTLTINGTTYDLSANRTWTVGTVTSVGLSMPSAFTVSNTPVTGSGTLTVTAAGTASQYVRGDGQLADFPQGGGGGGASVNYYLNGSVSQGTFGGSTYYEMNKSPVIGSGTNFTINADGYIASFLTDANDPNLLLIPGGNWNFELKFSASSGGGTPSFYLELYKYDGSTFTLISSSSSSPEIITGGTSIDTYYTTTAVPETVLSATDRLAIRIYVTHQSKTITFYTENNRLAQVITTFTTGLNALNGLTKQVQYFATGTSGTDFNISSSNDTHTFNFPTASATNRGLLSTTDWSTFNSKENVLTFSSPLSRSTNTISIPAATSSVNGYLTSTDWSTFNSKQDAITLTTTGTSGAATLVGSTLNIPNYGSSLSGYVPYTGATNQLDLGSFDIESRYARINGKIDGSGYLAFLQNTNGVYYPGNGYSGITSYNKTGIRLYYNQGSGIGDYKVIEFDCSLITNGATRQYKFPNADGTVALTTDIPTSLSLTTTGTSGAATLVGSTLNIPQYQAALTNPVTGTGTTNEIAYWTSSSAIGSLTTATYPSLTELSYVKGVTSAIQTQLNSKQETITLTTTGTTGAATFTSNTLNIPQYQGQLTLTTTGTSGAATLVGNTLNIPQYSGGGSMAIGGTVTSGTTGSILFIDPTATLAQDNANLFWDNTNNRLGIGTSSPAYTIDINGTGRFSDNLLVSKNQNAATSLTISNTTSGTGSASGIYITSNSTSGTAFIGKLSTLYTTFKFVTVNDLLIYNSDTAGGDISILNDRAAGKIKFSAGGSSTAQMTITSGGNFLIGTTTDSGNKLTVNGDGLFTNIVAKGPSTGGILGSSANGVTNHAWYNGNDGKFYLTSVNVATVGNFNMSTGAYTATSDFNKKKDIELSTLGLNEILQLIPKTYRFKTESDKSKKSIGFIAQDVKDIIPYAYQESKSGDETFIGLQYDSFIPVLVKAIQELKAEIDILKNK
jgi:hypothetical protein